jgi:tRNA (cmo5U34)-methyltransferase
MTRDTLYDQPLTAVDGFAFDARVAEVFQDMISRSVPGYGLSLSMIGLLADRYAQPGSRLYDLGCSLGAATLAMRHAVEGRGCRLVAVDNAPAMLARCREILDRDAAASPVDLICADIADIGVQNASTVVLNFTLQFVPAAARLPLLSRIRAGMREGGVLLLSEKLCFADTREQQAMRELHHDFKRAQGYSTLEISQKRAALEHVLIPETQETHLARLRQAGFSQAFPWFQCLNFASLIAFA